MIAKSHVVIYNLFLLILVNENLTLIREKSFERKYFLMKIQDYTKEMVDEKSFIDMAYTLLNDKQTTMNLYDIIDEFKSLGGYEYEDIETRVVQFYTDLNTDGRFLNVGENQWGLRDWYSVDDIEEKNRTYDSKI